MRTASDGRLEPVSSRWPFPQFGDTGSDRAGRTWAFHRQHQRRWERRMSHTVARSSRKTAPSVTVRPASALVSWLPAAVAGTEGEAAGLTGGAGAEFAARIAEKAFEYLDAPVKRVASLDVPTPYSPPLEAYYLPNKDKVLPAARELPAY